MPPFREVVEKGLDKCWLEATLTSGQLHLHVTELPPGARPHPAHVHNDIEAFYVLEGSGTIEAESGPVPLEANQVVILDARRQHSIVNSGSGPMRYLVITTKQ